MSDYLARLAGRVRHASPVLRPLLPSFFEPAITRVTNWAKTERVEIEHSLIGAPETVGNRITSTADVPPRALDPGSPFTKPADPEQKRGPEDPARTYISATPHIAVASEQTVASQPPEPTELPKSSPSHQPVATGQIIRSRQRDPSGSPSQELFHPDQKGSVRLVPQITRLAPETSPVAVPLRQSFVPQPAPSSESVRPQGQAISSLSLQPLVEAQAMLASPLPAAPEIHVTIGRIEVRAVSPAAPIQPRSRKPELSLDEYLRLRNKGTT